jgi:glycosyltransferase involved in cell wall biosynthesis
MNRFEILEVFLQKFGNRMKPLRGFPRDWDPCEIAVSIDGRGGDRKGKSFLSQDHYFAALRECDFVLSPPGWCMPLSHNLIEAVFCGAIPITNGGAFMAEPLADGLNCLEFEDAVGLVSVIERALAMDADEVERMRRAVLEYYDRFLEPKASGEKLLRSESARVLVNAEENSVPLVFAGMVFPWDVPPDTMQT